MPILAGRARGALFMALALAAMAAGAAETQPPWVISNGDPQAGLFMPRDIAGAVARGTRTTDGLPGPKYWQNHSAHNIRLSFDPATRRVTGEQDIVYTNASPAPLPVLIFRLYMNAHQPEAMREQVVDANFFTQGITVDSFAVDGTPKAWDDPKSPFAPTNIRGSTTHGVVLDKPVPAGGSVRLTMRWHYDLVRDKGWKEGVTPDGGYFLAYFYPRITNYSDYGGWDTIQFTLGREFNNDFNDYDVSVTVPRDYVVWATGELQNRSDVLQPAVAAKLAASRTSDRLVTLAEAADVRAGRVTARSDQLTWRWQATNVPDFAIAVSNQYRWEAASAVVDPKTGRRAGIEVAYADSATDFRPMVATAQQALTFASTVWPGVPYPYPKTSIVLGSADEEYPMMVNDGSNIGTPEAAKMAENAFTGFVATHEILHSWFPFYMGINEKRYPFMDEGWTTAFEYLRNREVLGVPAADALFRDFRINLVGWNQTHAGNELPVITPYDSLYGQSPVFAFNQYGKAALGYLALKDLMGDAAFRKALHLFMERWHGKRPLPWDMFNSFNAAGVGDFTWFFRSWFFGYNYMDLALTGVRNTPAGQVIGIRNAGGLPVPFDVVVTYADGSSERLHRTPAVWQGNPRAAEVMVAARPLRSVSLDTGIFEDFNPADNSWKP